MEILEDLFLKSGPTINLIPTSSVEAPGYYYSGCYYSGDGH